MSLIAGELWRFLLVGVFRVEFSKLDPRNWMQERSATVRRSFLRVSQPVIKDTELLFIPAARQFKKVERPPQRKDGRNQNHPTMAQCDMVVNKLNYVH